MRFDLQRFGGGKGGSTTTYTPSDEQRRLWQLQIESAQDRQPNERYMNEQGKAFMEKVIAMLDSHGSYDDESNSHNYLTMGDLAIDQTNQAMRHLARVADWHTEYELSGGATVQASWQTEPLVGGRNSQAAKELRWALRGASPDETDDSLPGFTQELGGWTRPAYDELGSNCSKAETFLVGSTGSGGINKSIGDLVSVVGGAVTTVNGDIDDYDGKFDSAVTTANTSTNIAQSKNDSLVSGLNTSIGSYNTLQSGKANAAESLLGGLNTSNNSAVTKASTILQPLITETRNAAFVANGNLDSNKLQGDVALTATNSILGGYGDTLQSATNNYISDTDARIDVNDDNADEIYQYSKTAATDAKDTASNNNADLSEYIQTNKNGLADSKVDLSYLKNGTLPEKYLKNMEDAIKRAMQNTIGATINSLGVRGVLNSSVTTQALNDIEKNAADQLAQKYLENIQTIERLSNDQFDHVITTDHENAEMTRQKNEIEQDALDRAFKYRQTGYEDLSNNSTQNAELELRELTAKQNEVTQGAGLAQQAHSNSVNQNQFDANLTQNQFGNTQAGIQNATDLVQNMYGNTTNANQLNANNINSSYNIQNDSVNSNWGRTQTGYNAGYQNNLQAIQNAQTHLGNLINGYNSEIGLHNNIFSNSLQGVNTRANLYGQQYNQYSSMINSLANMHNSRANIALNTFQQYGQWALDVYKGNMQANAADTQIYQQAISQAGLPIQFAGAAQEGAMYLPTSMWNASIGLNAPTLGAMNGLAGTGKTVVTQNGDNFWSSFGAGVAGAGVQRLVGSL